MPTIYSSLYTNFIRQGSTFAKSITTHGYAQSVVAATHPHVLNSQNRPVFGRRNTAGRFGRAQALFQTSAFHSVGSAAVAGGLSDHGGRSSLASHGGLDAYFENLQRKQAAGEADKEWSQFQFQKRIEWKPSPASILIGDGKQAAEAEADAEAKAAEDGREEARLTAQEEAALAEVDSKLERYEAGSREASSVDDVESRPLSPTLSRASSPGPRARSPGSASAAAPATRSASPASPQSQSYADHLLRLSESGRYAEIPVVFETMLATGVRPIASAYNALLMAAIHLPTERIEVVSRALDVYADMLRRKVGPDADTFNILVGLLAARSLEVGAARQVLEGKRVRYGGMEEPGKFMLASHEYDHAIVSEDDRLDLAVSLFDASVISDCAAYSAETYHQLILACAQADRVPDMLRIFEHLELNRCTPFAAIFPAMIAAYARAGNLVSAVECYNEYRSLAISHDAGEPTLHDRHDAQVYAALVSAYVVSGKVDGAARFMDKIASEYGARAAGIRDAVVGAGLVRGFLDRGATGDALAWAQSLGDASRARAMSQVAVAAADGGDASTAAAAYAGIPPSYAGLARPTMALLALSVRTGDIAAAARYWQVLSGPEAAVDASFVEPTAMYAVALIGSGRAAEGVAESDMMFSRIRAASAGARDEVDEGVEFVSQYMAGRGIADPREAPSPATSFQASLSLPLPLASPHPSSSTPPTVSSFEDTFDPHAESTDFKGSSLISDDLEGARSRSGPRLGEALNRFRNIRRAGRHPRYITYSKLISAAARERKMDLCVEILGMARRDVPLLAQYAAVRYGWSSILDAMVGACLTTGDRVSAEQYHQELLDIGATPSANTFGLYITTLKESTRTFDEATEAVKIFHRAQAEGVEPSSFLYNALIGKLGKARRIDDCLFYFAEMRSLGIRPTSVTYGTIVNALCRVSDDKFAEELFDEMEAMPNYKARPAPYNSMMQFFLTTKRDKAKVLAYFERMRARKIAPTSHTYKLLIDTHATLEPVDMAAAEKVLETMAGSGARPEPVHHAALIHARGCVLHDMDGALRAFDAVAGAGAGGAPASLNASVFQALFEAMVANHRVADTEPHLETMRRRGVEMTAYIANTLIHGWAARGDIARASEVYAQLGRERREPSTYEAMTRGFLAAERREDAKAVVAEMLGRGYPSAVVNKVLELLGGGQEGAAAA